MYQRNFGRHRTGARYLALALATVVGLGLATAQGLTGSPWTFTAIAEAGPAMVIGATSGSGQAGTVGTALAKPFVVTVSDANNNPVAGVSVTFAVATGGGSVSATTVATDDQGQAATTLTLGTRAVFTKRHPSHSPEDAYSILFSKKALIL